VNSYTSLWLAIMKQMQIAELTYIYEMLAYRMSVIVCLNITPGFTVLLLDQGKMNKRYGYSSRPLTPHCLVDTFPYSPPVAS